MGVNLDRESISFDKHVSNLYKKSGQKWSVFASLSSYFKLKQGRVLTKEVATEGVL